jgi:predicted enzyme related to lactoylglutathione lyase
VVSGERPPDPDSASDTLDAVSTVRICIDVSDLDAASTFYCEALECTEAGRSAGSVRLTAGGNDLYLLLRDEGSMPFPAAIEGRSFARHWSPIHLDFAVEDLARSTAEITRLGGSVEGRESGDWGSLTRCADPFGNGFCLLAN